MKNTIKLIGIIAITAIIGFSMAACASTSTSAEASAPAASSGSSIVNNSGEIWGISSMGGNRGYIFNADGTYARVGGMGGEHWEQGGGGNYSFDGDKITLTCEYGEAPETFVFAISDDVLSLTYEYDTWVFTKMKVNIGGF